MARNLTSSDRASLIRLASSMPVGSPQRKAILAGLAQTSLTPDPVNRSKASSSGKTASFSKEKLADTIAQTLMRTSKGLKVSTVETEFKDFKKVWDRERVENEDDSDMYEDVEYELELPTSYVGEVTFSISKDLLPPFDPEVDEFDPHSGLIHALSKEVSRRINVFDMIAGLEDSAPLNGEGFLKLEEYIRSTFRVDKSGDVRDPDLDDIQFTLTPGGGKFSEFELEVQDHYPKRSFGNFDYLEVLARFKVVGITAGFDGLSFSWDL
jgi:hypothetical protein